MKKCLHCGIVYFKKKTCSESRWVKSKFCSISCKNNHRRADRSIERRCSHCERKYIFEKKKGHTLRLCNSCSVNIRRFSFKKKALIYKGGQCEKCGYNKCDGALEFHHIDLDEKEFGISSNHCRSWNSIEKELDKCVLLCSNCHREMHYSPISA